MMTPRTAPMILNDSRSVPHLLVSSAASYAIAHVDPRGTALGVLGWWRSRQDAAKDLEAES